MIDVTGKPTTLRRAIAESTVEMQSETVAAIRACNIPTGDVLEMTRATAMLGLKRTPDLLPFCHPIPVDFADVRVTLEETTVRIQVEVAAIARTGVEVEAMTGAAVAALNVYDMVKPVDPTARIAGVRLLEKSGGASDFKNRGGRELRAGILVVSDRTAAGTTKDRAGAAVRAGLEAHGVAVAGFEIVPDEPEQVADQVRRWADDESFDLVFTVGGTGLGPRDSTPEALRPILEREIPGVAEAVRAYGQQRTPFAALSRTIAGQRGTTVIVALAGSTRGADESLRALMPWLLHVIDVFDKSYRHGA
ncbi:MAG: bifunctional molybdenum cofactor biosynthesis protein MoaC/MoaB [Thermoanaerobaculales bacterium]|nr:bifunctional molybdenum cofactor biosynthesis protein MoaC/MoaB [Thermoanaerobaculales bacterium]